MPPENDDLENEFTGPDEARPADRIEVLLRDLGTVISGLVQDRTDATTQNVESSTEPHQRISPFSLDANELVERSPEPPQQTFQPDMDGSVFREGQTETLPTAMNDFVLPPDVPFRSQEPEARQPISPDSLDMEGPAREIEHDIFTSDDPFRPGPAATFREVVLPQDKISDTPQPEVEPRLPEDPSGPRMDEPTKESSSPSPPHFALFNQGGIPSESHYRGDLNSAISIDDPGGEELSSRDVVAMQSQHDNSRGMEAQTQIDYSRAESELRQAHVALMTETIRELANVRDHIGLLTSQLERDRC